MARIVITELDTGDKGKVDAQDLAFSHISFRLSQSEHCLRKLFRAISEREDPMLDSFRSGASTTSKDSAQVSALQNQRNSKRYSNSSFASQGSAGSVPKKGKRYLTAQRLTASPLFQNVNVTIPEAEAMINECDFDGDGKLKFKHYFFLIFFISYLFFLCFFFV